MKALLYTSDPYEPSGVIGLFETEEQRQTILKGFRERFLEDRQKNQWTWPKDAESQERLRQYLADGPKQAEEEIKRLTEIEIPIGVYGEFY